MGPHYTVHGPIDRYAFHLRFCCRSHHEPLGPHCYFRCRRHTRSHCHTLSQHTAATKNFTCVSGGRPVTMEAESRVLLAEIKQSAITKAFAICLFLINWSSTVGSVYITALVASRKLEADSAVAALPFSTLLTVPAVRSLYFSSPSLGISIGKSCVPPSPPFTFTLVVFCSRLTKRLHETQIAVFASNGVFRLILHYVNIYDPVISIFHWDHLRRIHTPYL
jgi:hypothetical protein